MTAEKYSENIERVGQSGERKMLVNLRTALPLALCILALALPAAAQEDVQKQLSNPIASLTLVPFQFNFDSRIGPLRSGDREYVNIQPVVPIKVNDAWTLVVRTIMPVISQDDVFLGAGHQFGLGDTLQSFFFVPPTINGFTYGFGPALQYRTGTDRLLSSGKWGAGPTAVALQQSGPWTIGILGNHIWSYAGDPTRADVSNTFIQPFIAYAASGGWTFTVNSESTYDWVAQQWSVPINFMVSKLTKIGDQPVSLQAGPRYWITSPDGAAHGWGVRAAITFILK